MRIVNMHMNTAAEEGERFDTVISPAGAVASLLDIQERLGYKNILGVDEAFPGKTETRELLHQEIADSIRSERMAILFTVLIYNAESTLQMIREIRQEYGKNISIVVGGQLVPLIRKPYLLNADIDSVCIGDGEVILPSLLADLDEGTLKAEYEMWLKDTNASNQFAGMSYANFYKINNYLQSR